MLAIKAEANSEFFSVLQQCAGKKTAKDLAEALHITHVGILPRTMI